MASQYVGFRLNFKKDKDILDALDNAKDQTKEIKRLLRLGISAASGEVVVREVREKEKPKALDWKPSFENKAPVKSPDKQSIASNILGGFDF